MWTTTLLVIAGASLLASPRPGPACDPPGDDTDALTLTTSGDLAAVWRIQPPAQVGNDVAWSKQDLSTVAINNTLDRFHDSAAKADFDAYFSAWTNDSVFLGTDATERWTGAEFKAFAKPIFEKGKGWTYKPHDRHVTLIAKGTVAYFDELLDNAKLGLCRGSGILEKRGDDWKILQYNLSIPVPNDLALDVTRQIRDFKPGAPRPAPDTKPAPAPK